MIIAAIDIGSNAARLLINEVKTSKGKTEFIKLNLLRIPLRLGIDVFSKGEIGPQREKMVLDAMEIFKKLMEVYKVQHYRACATSAMRDAKNGEKIIREVKKTTGINIEIISGDEEASLIYENHIAETLDKSKAYLYVDVGGGSTEVTFYENGKLKYKHSFNIGTLRLRNGLVEDAMWKIMRQEIKSNIKTNKDLIAIGSGGNINKIFSMSKTKDGKPMTLSYIKKFRKQMTALTLEERMTKFNLREDRADVLLPALEIYINVLNWTQVKHIYVPKISVADGLIHHIYDKIKKNKQKS